jgi:6-phosphogluconolactonase
VWIYFGDERCVPPEHPASNYRMARETLLEHVPVPAAQIHRIEGERPPAEAARRYQETLNAAPPLDVVMLGMGDDGHVASWFPATPAADPLAAAVATKSPVAPHDRVSMTPGAISAARDVVLIVSGAAKAARLAEIHAQLRAERPTLPAARITAGGGPLRWFVDEEAAAELPPSPLDRRS